MKMFLRRLSGSYTGGAAGALAAASLLWLLAQAGVTARFGITLRADFSPPGLYRQLVWGGLWGLLFLLPLWRGAPVLRGFIFSLVPVAVILLVYFPRLGRDYLGFGYGPFAPLLVLLLGFCWGLVAALWHRSTAR